MAGRVLSRAYLLEPRSDGSEVAAVADKLGWPCLGNIPEDREVIWGRHTGLTLHFVEDHYTRSPYAYVSGEDEQRVTVCSRLVERQLRPATPDELLTAADTVAGGLPADEMLAVVRLGLGSPLTFDERFLTRIREAMQNPHEGIRHAGVWATAYIPWPQYLPLLDEVAAHDPVEDIRRLASKIVAGYEANRSKMTE